MTTITFDCPFCAVPVPVDEADLAEATFICPACGVSIDIAPDQIMTDADISDVAA